MPMTSGCLCGGSIPETIVKLPFISPEEPRPAMALPMMNMADDWAAPQTADPTSNTKKKIKKDHYTKVKMLAPSSLLQYVESVAGKGPTLVEK